LANAFDLCGKRRDGFSGLDTRPERAGAALFKAADSADAQIEGRNANVNECVGEILRYRSVDLSDEPEGKMKLILALPTEVGAVVHRVDE